MSTLTEQCVNLSRKGQAFAAPYERLLSFELAFTRTYRQFAQESPARRELECLRVQFPAVLQPIRKDDMFAGRIRYGLVGFSPEPMGLGYYCREDDIRQMLIRFSFEPEERQQVDAMLCFWRDETTKAKTRNAYPAAVQAALPSDAWTTESGIAFPLYRMAGLTLDYKRLLSLGIPGLSQMVRQRQSEATGPEEHDLFTGMLGTLDLLVECCGHYAAQLRTPESGAATCHASQELRHALQLLPHQAPQTLFQAIQLCWLAALLSGTWNYGRMDDYLGPFLLADLEAGRLNHESALKLLQGFWRQISAYDNQFNNRAFIGGRGRDHEAASDAFALLAIEATRTVVSNQPQLSLRFHAAQNPQLVQTALTCLGEGRTFPILYNDDINIPAVSKAFGVSEAVAVNYLPYGCGEYSIDHTSITSPNGVINLLKALEVTLHNGNDPMSGRRCGLATGDIADFATFEDLWQAYCLQVEHHVRALAQQQKIEYEVTGQAAPFLFVSLLIDDCVQRGQGVFSGGARYLGGTLETYGNINAADSLFAIKQVVYEEEFVSLTELVRACDTNFEGYEKLQRRLLAVPKFGNDHEGADAMAQRVHNHICNVTRCQAELVGLDCYLVVIINNLANSLFGLTTAASADGRKKGETLANAVNPSPGRDQNGTTAFLNSLTKLDPTIHAGAVHNMMFSRGMFTCQRPKLEALLSGYFRRGGTQAMITVVSRHELEEAMKEPEKWGHLMVRVGGFSARFIDLPRHAQMDVLMRTLNE